MRVIDGKRGRMAAQVHCLGSSPQQLNRFMNYEDSFRNSGDPDSGVSPERCAQSAVRIGLNCETTCRQVRFDIELAQTPQETIAWIDVPRELFQADPVCCSCVRPTAAGGVLDEEYIDSPGYDLCGSNRGQ